MSFRDRIAGLRRRFHRRMRRGSESAVTTLSRKHFFEPLERREMLAADAVQIGVLYTETDDSTDNQPDTFEVSFVGGAVGSELRRLEIDMSPKRLFFDTAETGRGTNGAADFHVVSLASQNPNAKVTATVRDGESLLVLQFVNFQTGDKLVFSIDVDEDETLLPTVTAGQLTPQIEPNIDAIASGAEFNDSILRAEVVAPHYQDVSGNQIFKHKFNLTGRGLDLRLQDNRTGVETRSAAAGLTLQQTPKPVAISGQVFLDHNLNLKKESGEQPIAGVKLELWQKVDGVYVNTGHTRQTDSAGKYEFGFDLNLQPGTYQVREMQPTGVFSVGAIVGTVQATKSGALVPGNPDRLTEIKIPLGDTRGINYDFAEARPASVSGYVYSDLSNDGIRNANEAGIGGVRIQVIPVNTIAPQSTVTLITDANGFYKAENLAPGEYRIVETVQPAGYFDGLDTPGRVDGVAVGSVVNPGDELRAIRLLGGSAGVEYNFGEIAPASLRGTVRLTDPDGNCFGDDTTNPPLAGVRVVLQNATGQFVAETTTNASGVYEFANLRPGEYRVVEFTPAELIDGDAHAGRVGGDTRGSVASDGSIRNVRLNAGDNGVNFNFCEHEPSSLAGFVYHDQNNNGVRDNGEAPISGATVQLLDGGGTIVASTLTLADGSYRFDRLQAGEYSIVELQPAGWLDGRDAAGTIKGAFVGAAQNPGDSLRQITLRWGDDGVNYNFGELLTGSIAGIVHADPNQNCVFDTGEQLIAGVTVDLLDANGNVLATTKTDTQGRYKFDNLAPGRYAVREHQPAGYFHGGQRAGSGGGDASVADLITAINVGSGQNLVHYDFCELPPSSLSGFVHEDLDQDCVFDENEAPIANVRVELLDLDGKLVASTTTDANGFYKFDGLAPGQYTVREIQPPGYFQGGQVAGSKGGDASQTDRVSSIQIGAGETLVNYNFCELPPSSLTGVVHADQDGDCEIDPDELRIAGVKVELLNSQGTVVASTTTNANGQYKFEGIAPGVYSVRETQPSGYFQGGQFAGSNGGDDSALDLITSISIGPGQTLVDYNFCEHPPASLTGIVHTDLDNDCVLDAGERLLAGVTIELRNGSGALVATTVTDAAGRYTFSNLEAGSYSVREIQPAGYFQGGQVVGHVDGAAGQLTTNGGLSIGGQLDGGLTNVGGSGDNSVPDVLANITIRPGERHVEYNFCEVPPASLSGRVFQDGDTIVTDDGTLPADLRTVRDGQYTPDDKPIAGVTIELRNGINGDPIDASAALPGMYPAGPIRTVTDSQGNYQFLGLPPGNYAVYQIHPQAYSDGIDTPGTTSGIAINPSDNVDTQIIRRLSQDPANDAIILIPLGAGQSSESNNFSEVRVEQAPVKPPISPLPPNPIPPRGFQTPASFPTAALPANVNFIGVPPAPGSVGGGGIRGFTWHLSVIDAGMPRGDTAARSGSGVVFQPASFLTTQEWANAQMHVGQWTLIADDATQGPERKTFYFGLPGGIPVSGDFNGDGLDEIGVFFQGRWYLDLNGDGRWDEEDLWAQLGSKDDLPVTGDWDGDGKDDIGTFGPEWPGDTRAIPVDPGLPDPYNTRALRPKNVPPKPGDAPDDLRLLKRTAKGAPRADVIDHVFRYGTEGDLPIAGDWNGDGISTIGIFRGGKWHLDMDGDGRWSSADVVAHFGQPGDLPAVGDFNGDGVDEIGVFREGQWILDIDGDRELTVRDRVFQLGGVGDRPVVGDWDGDGVDEPGLYREVGGREDAQARKP